MTETIRSIRTSKPILTIFLLAGLAVTLALAAAFERLVLFAPVDWWPYEQALRDLFHPYQNDLVFNPPWTFVLLAILFPPIPLRLGLLRLTTLIVFGALIYARAPRHKIFLTALLLTSAPVLYLVANANIDFFAALSFLIAGVSPAWALPLALIKPQSGALAGVAWLRKAWDTGRLSGVVRFAAPTAILLLVSFEVWGWWPADAWRAASGMEGGAGLMRATWNSSPFPWGIPVGVYLIWRAWQDGEDAFGAAASLLLSPYWGLYSVAPALALWLPRLRRSQAVVVWVALWVFYLVRFQGGLILSLLVGR